MRSVCLVIFSVVIVGAATGPLPPWAANNNNNNNNGFFPFPFGWPGAGAFAGPGMAMAGGGPGMVMAGGGFPFGFPFTMPSMLPFPMIPFPQITFPTPWYKGQNVCVDTKYYTQPDDVREMLDEPSMRSTGDFNHESESCKGNNEVYICTGRTMTNEGSKMYATKYKCCHGFIRPFDGRPGCIESTADAPPPPNPNNVQQSSFQSSTSNAQMGFVPLERNENRQ